MEGGGIGNGIGGGGGIGNLKIGGGGIGSDTKYRVVTCLLIGCVGVSMTNVNQIMTGGRVSTDVMNIKSTYWITVYPVHKIHNKECVCPV